MQTHEHTPSNTAETALWGYHNTVSAMLLSLSLSPCHLSFNILHLLFIACLPPQWLSLPPFTFTFLSPAPYNPVFPLITQTSCAPPSLCSVFPIAPPHFCLYLLAGWKLNCDPAHCSILGAARWECIGIHVAFLHLALYQSCFWFGTTGQRRTSSGVSASFVPPERQYRGALLLLHTKTKWLHMQQKHKHSRQLEKQLAVKQNQVVHIDNPR